MLTIKIRGILFCTEFSSMISEHSFPLSHLFLSSTLNFVKLHGNFQQQCPLVLPLTVDDVTQCELTCSQDAASKLGEVMLEGCSLGMQWLSL